MSWQHLPVKYGGGACRNDEDGVSESPCVPSNPLKMASQHIGKGSALAVHFQRWMGKYNNNDIKCLISVVIWYCIINI